MNASQNHPAGDGTLNRLMHDVIASVVVFLVALPLCMGIAIASGAPIAAGLITGIVGGLVVGTLAGAPLQVSGPAAGLTVIVYGVIQEFGMERLGLIVLMAGVMQIIAGALRLGQWFRAVSPAVIKGMLAGIGVLIFSSQFHVMVDDTPKETGLRNMATIPDAIRKGLPLPEWESTADRQYHTELLKQIGALHQRQTAVGKQLADSRREYPGADGAPAFLANEMIAEQRAITAELDRLTREYLQRYPNGAAREANGKASERKEKLAGTVNVAVAHSRAALESLEAGKLAEQEQTQVRASESLRKLLSRLKNHDWAAKLGLATILLIIAWQSLVPRRLRLLPGPLVAVVVVTGISWYFSLPVLYVEVPDNLFGELQFPTRALLSGASWGGMIKAAAVIAVIASAETLLCAIAVDQMHRGPRTKYDKELVAQGCGNTICGLLGALPMTGVIVRSAANVQAGAHTRLSAILHGVWLLGFVAGAAFLLRAIPTASLAAILVYTGYKLMNPRTVRELWQYGKGEAAIFIITVTTIVATDLLTGVLTGVALSGVKLLYTFSHLNVVLLIDREARRATLSLEGAATFIGLPKLAAKLEDVPANVELHVDFEHLEYIDHACLDLLMNWARQHEATGGSLVIDWASLHANFRREREPAANLAAAVPSAGRPAGVHGKQGTRSPQEAAARE